MGHVQRQQRGAFGALQRPERIGIALPIREPGDEICLRRPEHAVGHARVVFQTLQQHVVEAGRANDLADRNGGKAVEQAGPARVAAPTVQKIRVLLETRYEVADVIAEFGVTSLDMRQVGIGLAGLLRPRRPHLVGVYLIPPQPSLRIPVRRHAADGEDLVFRRAGEGGKQADRHDRVGEHFDSGIEGLTLGILGLVLVGRRLQHCFQIDRHRVIARGDQVLLMHVGRGE